MGEGASGGGGGDRNDQNRFGQGRPVSAAAKREMSREPVGSSPRPPPRPEPVGSSPRPPPRPVKPEPSGRPVPAVGYAAMNPEERLRERQMGAQFANLELRADMDPYLAGDPLARLGFDPERVQWYDSPHRTTAFYTPFDINIGGMVSPQTARRYNEMYPGTNLTVPGDTIVMNSVSGLPTLAHEARHRGYDKMEGLAALPDMPLGFNMEGPLDPEQFTEIGDEPILDERMNLPRGVVGFPEGATYRTMRDTLDTNPAGSVMRGYYDQVQNAAQGVLSAAGEPPRAVMQVPGRGNMFYQPTGIEALFSKIGGFFD